MCRGHSKHATQNQKTQISFPVLNASSVFAKQSLFPNNQAPNMFLRQHKTEHYYKQHIRLYTRFSLIFCYICHRLLEMEIKCAQRHVTRSLVDLISNIITNSRNACDSVRLVWDSSQLRSNID